MRSRVRQWSSGWQGVTARDGLWLVGLVAAFWAVNVADFGIRRVPGHSLAFWLPMLVLTRARLGRPGSALAVASVGGLLVKMPHFHGWGMLGFLAAAGGLELLLPGDRGRKAGWLAFIAVGAAAGLAKWLARLAPGLLLLGLDGNIHILPMWATLGMHLGFGMLGGLSGAVAHRGLPGRE